MLFPNPVYFFKNHDTKLQGIINPFRNICYKAILKNGFV